MVSSKPNMYFILRTYLSSHWSYSKYLKAKWNLEIPHLTMWLYTAGTIVNVGKFFVLWDNGTI